MHKAHTKANSQKDYMKVGTELPRADLSFEISFKKRVYILQAIKYVGIIILADNQTTLAISSS